MAVIGLAVDKAPQRGFPIMGRIHIAAAIERALLQSTSQGFQTTAQETLRTLDIHDPVFTRGRLAPITIYLRHDILFEEGQVEGLR